MAGVYLSRNDSRRAEELLHTAIQFSPLLSEPYMDLAVLELRRGQTTLALEYIDKAATLKDSGFIHLNRGDILSALGRYSEAAQEYDRAVTLRPDLADLRRQVQKRLQQLRSMGLIPPPPQLPAGHR
jgi:Tfp pilus assembly protein PilF